MIAHQWQRTHWGTLGQGCESGSCPLGCQQTWSGVCLGSPLSQGVASCTLEGRPEALGPGKEALFPSSFQLLTRSEVVPADDAGMSRTAHPLEIPCKNACNSVLTSFKCVVL